MNFTDLRGPVDRPNPENEIPISIEGDLYGRLVIELNLSGTPIVTFYEAPIEHPEVRHFPRPSVHQFILLSTGWQWRPPKSSPNS